MKSFHKIRQLSQKRANLQINNLLMFKLRNQSSKIKLEKGAKCSKIKRKKDKNVEIRNIGSLKKIYDIVNS
jgi:uncharacterized protein YggU (UPF0235/DUF167 family)